MNAENIDGDLVVEGDNYRFIWNADKGLLSKIESWDGITWNQIHEPGLFAGFPCDMKLEKFQIQEKTRNMLKIAAKYINDGWNLSAEYEIYSRGYVICTFCIEALADCINSNAFKVGISLNKAKVFSNNYRVKNGADSEALTYERAISVDFSTDSRPVTNSIDFLLESVRFGINGEVCKKVDEDHEEYRFLGWQMGKAGLLKKGSKYENRWCISVSGLRNGVNKVRGQRIYHWYGLYPSYPSEDIMDEMIEYGCSILVLHMPSFKHISGCEPVDERKLIRTINKAHSAKIKVLFYCQPYLISINSPDHIKYKEFLTGDLPRWDSMKDTQIVFYRENTNYDCDALCLRCNNAFRYIRDSVIKCYRMYGFDGLYIDWAWPEQGICNDTDHGHESGLFNFYDYIRMIREWREEIGPDAIMIGHGGSLLTASDFVEGFDACLTGEAQGALLPQVIGQQYGLAPALWAMHRRKEQAFRSRAAISGIIREGVIPHTGIGIMGTSVIASVDPAYNAPLMALWQMWRAFPVHKATFYNYMTEQVISVDNDEFTYSLYITAEKEILLIVCNAGGEYFDSMPSVGSSIWLDIRKLGLNREMNCWRMKGNTYETFRISKTDNVINGEINVPELGLYEFIGFVLSRKEPPEEMLRLMSHLKGRYKRQTEMNELKLERLTKYDELIDDFTKNSNNNNSISYSRFMTGRTAE